MYLVREVTRHGKVKWYFRRGHGPRIEIVGEYGSPQFMANYSAALNGSQPEVASNKKQFTIAWCIEQFTKSHAWGSLANESRKQLSYQFSRLAENAGLHDFRSITRKDVLAGRDRRAGTPSDANKYVRAMAMLAKFAVDQEWISASPVHGISKLKTGNGRGFYTWTQDDFSRFEAHWQIGTMQRLAYEIYFNTGLRRGDVHKFGRQHIRGNVYTVHTSKTGRIVESVLTQRLVSAIAATECGQMTLLLTARGIPFSSAQSLGNWFGAACEEAGVAGNAHGIRKGVACLLAESEMTEAQLNAFFGWSHGSKESAVYIAQASRAKLAKQAANVLSRTFKKGEVL